MLYLCSLAALLATASAAAGSCPAGAAGATCRGGGGSGLTDSKHGTAAKVHHARPTADIITQELQELVAMKELANHRIDLLEDMKATLNSGMNVSLPEKHMRVLREPMPLMSAFATNADKMPAANSAADYLVSKAIISATEPVSFIKFLPLKSRSSTPGTSSSVQPSALLVTVQADSSVSLFTPNGERILTFSTGHDRPVINLVTNLAVSQSQEDSFITTADAGGAIRVHRVEVRLRKANKQSTADATEEKVSQYLTSKLNVTTQLVMQMQVPTASNGEPAVITALAVASQGGARFFVAGDEEGKVSVFGKNGSFMGAVDVAVTAGAKVEALNAALGSVLFHVGSEWGFLHLDKLEVQHMDCPDFEGRVTAAVIDSQKASRVLITDEEGSLWAFNVKDKKKCQVEYRFQRGVVHAPLELASIQGFALALEHAGPKSDVAFVSSIDMARIAGRRGDTSTPIVWRSERAPVKDWAVHKRYQQGDFLAFLSEDGLEVEVLELLNMQVAQPPKEDSFGSFKMPIIAVAIVLVLGYQYMKQKNKFGGAKGGGRGGARGGGGMGGLDSLKGGGFDASEFADLKQKIQAKKAEKAGGASS